MTLNNNKQINANFGEEYNAALVFNNINYNSVGP